MAVSEVTNKITNGRHLLLKLNQGREPWILLLSTLEQTWLWTQHLLPLFIFKMCFYERMGCKAIFGRCWQKKIKAGLFPECVYTGEIMFKRRARTCSLKKSLKEQFEECV